ncbi:MAG: SRPBCC family protein [Pseudorhodoplanes sp.]|nr:hypothetical protein [Pseudorhodoplanes sp.]MBW7947926.1 SRPBCC family protein [Pseudorhodoplanes sp.]MCQ3941589.1 polyketide cyclase [Alphaproteobacteria bacterium]
MLTLILIALGVMIAAVAFLAATKPDTFRISRSTTVDASPERIFPLVNELRAHRSWSPFNQDPAMKRTYSGPDAGKGSVMAFDGGYKTGVGRLSITEAAAPSRILMNLVMTRPLRCDNVVEFTFERQGSSTLVTWAMHGPQTFAGTLMSVFVDCNKMCERQFDAGLTRLKEIAEGNRVRPAA